METVANQPQPPGFEQIRRAYETALELPEWRPMRIRVGVCRGNGDLIASAEFNDRRQARLFSIQMTDLGYQEAEGGQGCDTLFVPRYYAAHGIAQAEAQTA